MRKTNGEPYTGRLVRTVRGQALGNLPSQDGKALSAEPTIYQYLNCRKPFDRLWISSLTDKAIREGLANLKDGRAYEHLYQSAKSRSEADWLVGINASRALSIGCKGGYSLGRVQTPTLAMVCKRYTANRDFKAVPYWKLSVLTSKESIEIKATSQNSFEQKEIADNALLDLSKQETLKVEKVGRKASETAPPLLHDLTTLQKEANKRYGFSADKTLSIAQSLYEKKITTYPRTGSRYISEDVFDEVPMLFKALHIDLAPPLNRHSVDDSKVTDHHAIIPTGEICTSLSTDEQRIYELIKIRFIESFSPNSREERMQVELSDGSTTYQWKGCQIISWGWKGVKKETLKESINEENN